MSESVLFSRAIAVSSVPEGGTRRHIEANEEERAALAAAFGLLGVDALTADVAIMPWEGDGFSVGGRVMAAIRQSCVVSLVPVAQTIDEPFETHFVPAGSRLAGVAGKPLRDVVVQVGADDPPEIFSGKTIDLGAIVTEHFALAIDPYPRAPDAKLPATVERRGRSERTESPFDVLAKLKKQGGIKG